MIQIRIYTPDARNDGLPPEFRSEDAFDHAIETHDFGEPYAAALFLLERCSLKDLQHLAVRELRGIRAQHSAELYVPEVEESGFGDRTVHSVKIADMRERGSGV